MATKRKPNYTTNPAMNFGSTGKPKAKKHVIKVGYLGSTGKIYTPQNPNAAKQASNTPFVDVTLKDASGVVAKVKAKKKQEYAKRGEEFAKKFADAKVKSQEKSEATKQKELDKKLASIRKELEGREKRAQSEEARQQARADAFLKTQAAKEVREREKKDRIANNFLKKQAVLDVKQAKWDKQERAYQKWAKQRAHQKSWNKNKRMMGKQIHKLISF